MLQFGMSRDEELKAQRPERATVIGHNRRNRGQHACLLIDGTGLHESVAERPLKVRQRDCHDRVTRFRGRRGMERMLEL